MQVESRDWAIRRRRADHAAVPDGELRERLALTIRRAARPPPETPTEIADRRRGRDALCRVGVTGFGIRSSGHAPIQDPERGSGRVILGMVNGAGFRRYSAPRGASRRRASLRVDDRSRSCGAATSQPTQARSADRAVDHRLHEALAAGCEMRGTTQRDRNRRRKGQKLGPAAVLGRPGARAGCRKCAPPDANRARGAPMRICPITR